MIRKCVDIVLLDFLILCSIYKFYKFIFTKQFAENDKGILNYFWN